jgi:hypothetical protein
MGRYEEKDTSFLADRFIPPKTVKVEIEDTETGKKGEGAGFTKEEARANAWRDLKEKK